MVLYISTVGTPHWHQYNYSTWAYLIEGKYFINSLLLNKIMKKESTYLNIITSSGVN